MRVLFHKNFKKQYKKLSRIQKLVDARLVMFMEDSFNSVLNNHGLQGAYKGYRSINISSDYCAVYELVDDNTAFFVTIGTHSNLYA